MTSQNAGAHRNEVMSLHSQSKWVANRSISYMDKPHAASW